MSKVYLEQCIKKKLILFITKYHNLQDVLFWPDMATSHYAKIVINYLEQKNIDFVPKCLNTPNVP